MMQILDTLPEDKHSSAPMEPIATALHAMFSQAVGGNQIDLVRHYLTLEPRLATIVGVCNPHFTLWNKYTLVIITLCANNYNNKEKSEITFTDMSATLV
jgi:mitochondrial fission protein ELM1